MHLFENEELELKGVINKDFKKEIISMANTNGGKIIVGVNDFGKVVGVEEIEITIEKISNLIRDGIKPDLTGYTAIERKIMEGKEVIIVHVNRGGKRPYHLSDKGLKPSSVFVRHGTSSVPASEEMIREMIKECDGIMYDGMRSINQLLSFEYATHFFNKMGISLDQKHYKSLKMVNNDGYYTNLGLLLSDQCEHSIKCAIFEGTQKTKFVARKEFFGSILKQIDEVYEYISLINHTSSTFSGLRRIDQSDYPEYAVREALLNAIVHRDYDYSGSILINIYENRMEVVSIGGLVKGISVEDIMNGVSQSRNMALASVFYRLELIESYGTGIARIMESYKDCVNQPTFTVGPASFVTTLPNINYYEKHHLEDQSKEEKVMKLFQEMGFVTRKDIEMLLQVSSFPAGQLINQLLAQERIEKIGSGRTTRYKLKYKK